MVLCNQGCITSTRVIKVEIHDSKDIQGCGHLLKGVILLLNQVARPF